MACAERGWGRGGGGARVAIRGAEPRRRGQAVRPAPEPQISTKRLNKNRKIGYVKHFRVLLVALLCK